MTETKDPEYALVTGAASGIGLAIALALAESGNPVICLDKNPLPSMDINDQDKLVYYEKFDLNDTSLIGEFIRSLSSKYGRITMLVNNAGIHKGSTLEETDERDWNLVLTLNVSVPFLLIKHMIPVMRAAGKGAIVNMSSRNALRSTTGNNAYDASKAALLALTRTAAGELAGDNIRVNAVCPGIISTPMKDEKSREGRLLKAIHRKLVPMDRYGNVSEIASIVLFLLSDQASYVTGSALVADGGQLACMDNSRLMELVNPDEFPVSKENVH